MPADEFRACCYCHVNAPMNSHLGAGVQYPTPPAPAAHLYASIILSVWPIL
jgi:hypothetical protein